MLWHPDAKLVPYPDAGAFEPGFGPRGVAHTVEGSVLPRVAELLDEDAAAMAEFGADLLTQTTAFDPATRIAIAELEADGIRYSGSAPHFTIDTRHNVIYQHIALNRAAKALRGSNFAGIATNHAHAIQFELIAFSDRAFAKRVGREDLWVGSLTALDWQRLAQLARWIEANAKIERTFPAELENRAHPMSKTAWKSYRGWCGHQNVPGQDHWDPSSAFRKDLFLGGGSPDPDYPPLTRTLKRGSRGGQVGALKLRLHKRGYRFIDDKPTFGLAVEAAVEHFQRHHNLDVDGVVGPNTWAALFS